jgi:hypothetical protein
VILFNGTKRANWAPAFHGLSEADQLTFKDGGTAKFVVRPGDVAPRMSGERAEVYVADANLPIGRECFIAWETLFPTAFVLNPGGWNFFFQLHESGQEFQSNLAMRVNYYGLHPFLEASLYGGDPAAPDRVDVPVTDGLVLNKWYEFVLRLRLVPSSLGFLEGWVNGQRFSPMIERATTYVGRGVYPKLGYYRGAAESRTEIWHRRFKIATALNEVLA